MRQKWREGAKFIDPAGAKRIDPAGAVGIDPAGAKRIDPAGAKAGGNRASAKGRMNCLAGQTPPAADIK